MNVPASNLPDAAPPTVGHWSGAPEAVTFTPANASAVLASMRQNASLVFDPRRRMVGLALGGTIAAAASGPGYPLLSCLGPMYPEWLGDRGFMQMHGLRFAYVGGAMARGITTSEMVIALANIGAMAMFGAAGLGPDEVEAALNRISAALDARGLPWGSNLIHSPNEPRLEETIVDLYLRHKVRRVDASAYMGLTPAVVRYACTGLHRDGQGKLVRLNHLFAKISREEVARHFLSPAPAAMLDKLVAEGKLTAEEAELARDIPLAEHLIVESDSGGHTDNRPLNALFPVIARLRDELSTQFGYSRPIHLGAAGSLGTPEALAAAFALGAAFVVVGSVHQSARESGVASGARAMLAEAGPADSTMTASADMFELGVKVQVLKRGTMMAVRGNQLYELYRRHASLDDIPPATRASIEKDIFRMPLDTVWKKCTDYFALNDPSQIERALRDPKHKMALVFRWYVGNTSRWPLIGEDERRSDYQLWCGPAMGAFNRWVAGSFLQGVDNRSVAQIALNLLEGAAVVTRAHQYRSYGLPLAADAFRYTPSLLQP